MLYMATKVAHNKMQTLNDASYHGSWLLASKHTSQIVHDFSHVVVRNLGTPACSYALSSINQHHWYDRNVPLRLNSQVVVSQMTQ